MVKFLKGLWSSYKKYAPIFGILVTGLSLYLTYNPPSQDPHLTFFTKSIDVFREQDPNEDLQISFKGRDVKKEKLSLTAYEVKLINDGKSDLEIEKFDKTFPFGLKVKNGFITSFKVLSSNGEEKYLGTKIVSDLKSDSSTIVLNPAVIKRKHFIKFKFIILHRNDVESSLITLGQIGNTEIDVLDASEESKGDWKDMVYGLFMLIVILGAFFFGLYLFFMLIYLTISFVRRIIFKLKVGVYYDSNNIGHRILKKLYGELGKKEFLKISKTLSNKNSFEEFLRVDREYDTIAKEYLKLVSEKKITAKEPGKYESKLLDYIAELVAAKLAVETDITIQVNEEFLKELTHITELLTKNK